MKNIVFVFYNNKKRIFLIKIKYVYKVKMRLNLINAEINCEKYII